ncbi:hypothetical protein LW135_03150 [Helicobacter sp. faydin-H20]|uniref:hypothetical protein n=1 Tax=Helicobacter anatolicus TaxID=2905874 RepID=UPI001E31B36E|nr:hypothetical protein [Helicobacter anatolicus]MCE3036827.1 hypothetical protein [Helicobacter anatolicus]
MIFETQKYQQDCINSTDEISVLILTNNSIDKGGEEKILEDKNRAIFIDGYGTYTLESFLNPNIPNDERVNIIY